MHREEALTTHMWMCWCRAFVRRHREQNEQCEPSTKVESNIMGGESKTILFNLSLFLAIPCRAPSA
jgi:hypothetical protein